MKTYLQPQLFGMMSLFLSIVTVETGCLEDSPVGSLGAGARNESTSAATPELRPENEAAEAATADEGEDKRVESESAQPNEGDMVPKEEASSPMDLAIPLAANSCIAASTSGTVAARACFNRGTGAGASIDLTDVKCDAHSVYVLYTINTNNQVRKENSSGCHTTLHIPLQRGSFQIQYKTCVDIQLAPDICSNIVFDHN